MPVFLTQWRDGDFSLTHADTREQAHAHFQEIACLPPENIIELEIPHLTVSFTLDRKGDSIFSHYDGAIEEARQICHPALIEALGGLAPRHVTDPARVAAIDKIVDNELKIRRTSKLSKRLASKVPRTRPSRPRT